MFGKKKVIVFTCALMRNFFWAATENYVQKEGSRAFEIK